METAGHQEAKRRRIKPRGIKRRIKPRGMKGDEVLEEKHEEDDNIVSFRRHWENCYLDLYCSFDDTTAVPPMRYTFGSIPNHATPEDGLQIFSVKVAQLKEEEGLHWPLHVYGLIATRDSIDPRRNHLFHRARDHCQTLTQEDPFLLLTGPSRAVVLIDPVSFEVQLKAKGKTESEDKVLIFDVFVTRYACGYPTQPPRIVESYLNCNRSKLEFTFAILPQSVEATIRVQVVDGSWTEDFRGLVIARTASINQDIVLVDSRDERMAISDSGIIELSRRVVSVELGGELKVDVVAASQVGGVAEGCVVFTPKKATISYGRCDLGFCKLGINAAWSQFVPWELEHSCPRINVV